MNNAVRVLAAVCLAPLASAGQQPEPFVECIEGVSPEPCPIAYGEHTSGAAIDTSVDIDSYEFEGSAGDVVRLILNASGSFVDPQVTIFDPNGDEILTDSCSNGCSLVIDATLTEDGTHTILVQDVGNNNSDSYVMQLERIPPILNVAPLDYGAPASDELGISVDVDFYELNVAAGTLVSLIMNAGGSFLDARVDVHDSASTLIATITANDGGSTQINLDIPEDDTYLLVVYDVGYNNSDDYLLSAQCLLGPCPPPSPWTNLGNGLAGETGVPILVGSGDLLPGTTVGLKFANARKLSSLTLVVGTIQIDAPFKGGVLVPKPDVLSPAILIGPDGVVCLSDVWPGAPSGFAIYLQGVVQDPDAPKGLALSNAVCGVVP